MRRRTRAIPGSEKKIAVKKIRVKSGFLRFFKEKDFFYVEPLFSLIKLIKDFHKE